MRIISRRTTNEGQVLDHSSWADVADVEIAHDDDDRVIAHVGHVDSYTRDTPHDICTMLLQGYSPEELLRWRGCGKRLDPNVLKQAIPLAVAELRRQGKRDLAHADALEAQRGISVVK